MTRHRPRTPITAFAALAVSACAVLAGCGYTVGNSFQAQVRTVSVPVFKNETFRRGIELQLTSAVQKEILDRTPFRLADDSTADTRLVGTLVQANKAALAFTPFNDPRQLQLSLAIEVRWEDLRSGQVLAYQRIPISPETVALVSNSEWAPELGQSRATAERQGVETLARSIVDLMETPW